MDIRDLITVVAACAIVALLALVVQPALNGEGVFGSDPEPTPAPPQVPATPTPEPTETGPYRIFYTPNPGQYPLIFLPDNMSTFGASDPEWHSTKIETFGFLRESQGGITQYFSVPYPLWRINSTLEAQNHPQSGLLEWVLVNAETGGIIDGGEVRHREVVRKNIQVSTTRMYLIVRVRDADRYTLSFERPVKVF
ncbi:MAG: hypothetical protein APR53_05235 [Methanoculleus sp. SDB]|nr:MAG: hypothetical protein APR53_05235 [Methanoculleus sp. SDB]